MNLLVLGPQGAGKGTQAKRIGAEYELPHVSTGDMFRAAIAAQTELGKRVQPILASGALVPDDVTVALIRERLGEPDAAAGFVLDGFPRNLAQAEALDEMLREIGRSLDAILFFDLPDSVATERMLRRAERGEPARRHARRDRAPPRDLPLRDRADRRVLPRDGQAGAVARRASDRAGLGRDRLGTERTRSRMIIRKSQAEIEAMAAAGRIVADTLALLGESLAPGLTMLELDAIGDEYIQSQGAYPTSKGYKGFPAAICISPNSMIVHGIPGHYVAQEGDIVTFDVGVTLERPHRRLGRDLPVRRDLAGGAAAARRLPDRARGRDRAGDTRQQRLGHLAGRADGHGGGRLQRRPQPRRARGRPVTTTRTPRCRISSPATVVRSSRKA